MNTDQATTTASARPENVRVESVKVEWISEAHSDLSYEENKERLASYGDSWEHLGCVAKAQVSYVCGLNGERRLETLTSGGLWGIESDSGKAYMDEVESDQLSDLESHLYAFGINISKQKLNQLRD